MTTNFPGSLDTFLPYPSGTSHRNNPSLAARTNNLADAIKAVEAAVGTTGSAVPTSLTYKVDALEDGAITPAGGQIVVQPSATSGTDINAAIAALPASGGTILLAAGTHTINTAILINKDGVVLRGVSMMGTLLQFDAAVVTPAIRMADTTQRRVFIQDLRINTTGGSNGLGTAIDASYFVDSVISRIFIGSSSTQAPNIGIDFNANGTYYNRVEYSRIVTNGTNPIGIRFGNVANSNLIHSCRIGCFGTGGTGILVTGATHSILLIQMDMENHTAIGVDVATGCNDVTIFHPYLEALTIGVRLAAGVESVRILGGYIATNSTANIQDNGAVGLTVDNCWVDFEPYNSLDRTGTVKSRTNAVDSPGNFWTPGDLATVAWAYDPNAGTNNSSFVNGTLYLVQLVLRYPVTVTNLQVALSTGATTSTANQNFLGLYNSAGTRVAQTAAGVADTPFQTSGTKTLALSAPFVATPGKYWVAILTNAATPAQAIRANGTPSIANLALSGANMRFAVNGTGLTTLPASITVGSNTNTGAITYWAGAS